MSGRSDRVARLIWRRLFKSAGHARSFVECVRAAIEEEKQGVRARTPTDSEEVLDARFLGPLGGLRERWPYSAGEGAPLIEVLAAPCGGTMRRGSSMARPKCDKCGSYFTGSAIGARCSQSHLPGAL